MHPHIQYIISLFERKFPLIFSEAEVKLNSEHRAKTDFTYCMWAEE